MNNISTVNLLTNYQINPSSPISLQQVKKDIFNLMAALLQYQSSGTISKDLISDIQKVMNDINELINENNPITYTGPCAEVWWDFNARTPTGSSETFEEANKNGPNSVSNWLSDCKHGNGKLTILSIMDDLSDLYQLC